MGTHERADARLRVAEARAGRAGRVYGVDPDGHLRHSKFCA
jgi:hypothetical protein